MSGINFGMRFAILVFLVNLMGSMGLVVFVVDTFLRALMLFVFEMVLAVIELIPSLSQIAIKGRQTLALHRKHHPY